MHVVIDLGETHSYLTCWGKGNPLEDACIKIKLPGVSAFKSTIDENSWERENLRAYFSYLYREYLLPSRITIESAALAIPVILDLHARRILLDILEEIFGLYEANIIPHSIALIAGIQMRPPHVPLSGDILVIEAEESSCNFAFISMIETIGITLEKQFSGDIPKLMAESLLSGYYSAKQWRLDHLLLVGNHSQDPTIEAFITSLPPGINVIYDDDPGFTAAEGLATSASNHAKASTMLPFNVIYPFEFYLEENNSTSLERIPFDTANLELNCGGRYRIMSLSRSSIDNLAKDANRLQYRIYELRTADGPHLQKPIAVPLPVLEIDIQIDDMPPYLELGLDMAASAVLLGLTTEAFDEVTPIPAALELHLRANQQKLYETLSTNFQNETLLADWNQSLLSPLDDDPTLAGQVNQTLFHLYGLLQLWQGK